MRAAGVTLVAIASVLLVAVLLAIVLRSGMVPTTFGCRTFIDASAEARLEYPNGRLLSYASHEGARDLIGMSNPQSPGFTKYWEISPGDQEAFRWFDEQLQAQGWKPLTLHASPQFRQSGSTERGSVVVDGLPRPAEVISLTQLEGSQVDIVEASGSSPQAVVRYIYLITTPAAFPACR
jgi:hypothetical protein